LQYFSAKLPEAAQQPAKSEIELASAKSAPLETKRNRPARLFKALHRESRLLYDSLQ
jgi:hypothetical protein